MDLLDEADREHVLRRYNDPSPAPDATIVDLVQRQAALDPYAIAVVASDGTLTYQQLNERANQLARHLRTLGAGPERIVAVCHERGLELFVALLAIVKSGAAYVPLDPSHPDDRLRFVLSDTAAVLSITSPTLRDRVPAGATPTLVLGPAWPDTIPPTCRLRRARTLSRTSSTRQGPPARRRPSPSRTAGSAGSSRVRHSTLTSARVPHSSRPDRSPLTCRSWRSGRRWHTAAGW